MGSVCRIEMHCLPAARCRRARRGTRRGTGWPLATTAVVSATYKATYGIACAPAQRYTTDTVSEACYSDVSIVLCIYTSGPPWIVRLSFHHGEKPTLVFITLGKSGIIK